MELISKGAEAEIYKTPQNTIIKKRTEKKYRNPQLDQTLRKQRTKKEIKIIQKLQQLKIKTPKLITYSEKNATIEMEYIEKDIRNQLNEKNTQQIATQLAEIIATLHDNSITHGDLTTGNILIKNNQLYLIDFGLSQTTNKTEDKAVDIHLLKQAINSKHPKISKQFTQTFTQTYQKKSKQAKETLKRLEKVEQRGRYKTKNKKIN